MKQARGDLKWTALLAEQGGYHLACFLPQQVAEKALKAFLYAQGEEIVLGHSVERLGRSAGEYKIIFVEKGRSWSLLDGYYIPTRYPSAVPDGIPADVYTRDAAQQAVDTAREVIEIVGEFLK